MIPQGAQYFKMIDSLTLCIKARFCTAKRVFSFLGVTNHNSEINLKYSDHQEIGCYLNDNYPLWVYN